MVGLRVGRFSIWIGRKLNDLVSNWCAVRAAFCRRDSDRFVMMRLFRNILYLSIGLLLGGLLSLAHAETIAAQIGEYEPTFGLWNPGNNGFIRSTPQQACTEYVPQYYGSAGVYQGIQATTNKTVVRCIVSYNGNTVTDIVVSTNAVCHSGDTYNQTTQMCAGYLCPSGYQGPGNYNGQANMCSGCPAGKEDVGGQCLTVCPSGYHRNVPDNGQCEKDCIGEQFQKPDGKCACTPGGNQVVSFVGAMQSTGCTNGCLYQMGSFSVGFGGGSPTQTNYSWGKKTGGICGANTSLTPAPTLIEKPSLPPSDTSGKGADGSTPDPKNTPENNKDPMSCGAAGGSWGSYNGVGKCLSPSGDKTVSTTKPSSSTTTNSDGSSSTTNSQETTTCDGQSCATTKSSTTTTSGSGGSSTSTTESKESGTGSGSGVGSGDGTNDGEDKGDCSLEPGAPYCKSGTVKEKGSFGDSQSADLEAAKSELRSKFAEIKAAALAMFNSGGSSSGGGGLPCYAPVVVFGHPFSMCFTQYASNLSPIGGFVIFAASLLAVFIVLRR